MSNGPHHVYRSPADLKNYPPIYRLDRLRLLFVYRDCAFTCLSVRGKSLAELLVDDLRAPKVCRQLRGCSLRAKGISAIRFDCDSLIPGIVIEERCENVDVLMGNGWSCSYFLARGVDVRVHNRDDPRDRTITQNLLKQIAGALEVTDFIALMMVLVTALSAYATWKTAQVTNEILLTSQRPYIGTESLNLIDEANPKIVADVRNFGTVQAEDAIISIVVKVNEKPLSGDSEPHPQDAPIVLSLAVPHRFYSHITADTYRDTVQGKANLVVEIRARYRGPRGDEHCYMARHSYDHIDGTFYSRGGSLSCDGQPDPVSAR